MYPDNERATVTVKCLAQEHHAMSLALALNLDCSIRRHHLLTCTNITHFKIMYSCSLLLEQIKLFKISRCRKAGFTCTCPSLTVTGVTNNIANFKQKKGENVQCTNCITLNTYLNIYFIVNTPFS